MKEVSKNDIFEASFFVGVDRETLIHLWYAD